MADTHAPLPPLSAQQLLADARQLLAQLDGSSLRELSQKAGLNDSALEAVLSGASGSSNDLPLPSALHDSIQQLWQQALQLAADQQGLSLAALPADARAEISNLKKQLNGLDQQLKARLVAEQTLQKQLGKARIEIATLKSSQLNARLLEEGAAKEKAHAEQYHKQFEAAKAEIYQLNKALDSVRKKHQELTGEQQQEISRLKQELAEQLAARNNEQQQLQSRYEQQLNALEQQLASERQRAEAMQRQQQQLQQQLQHQQQEHSSRLLELEEQLAQQPANTDEQQAQLTSLQAEVESLHEKLVDRDMALSDLTQALETAQQAMGSLEGQLLGERSEFHKKQQQAAEKVVELQAQVKELNSHLRDYHAARSEREELQQSVSALEHKLVESHALRESLSRFHGRMVTDLEVAVMQIGDPTIRAQLNKLVESYQSPPPAATASKG